jgi:hypothetical protein
MFFGVNLQNYLHICKLYCFMFVGVKLKWSSLQQRARKFTSKLFSKIDP